MRRHIWPTAALLVLVAVGCVTPAPASPTPATPTASADTGGATGPEPTPTPAPVDDPIAAFIADLQATGVEARQAEPFMADPLSRRGLIVCVAGEAVQVYIFDTPDEAAAQAARIDPRDPSNVGTAHIDWAGNPKFWLRGNLLVLYLRTEHDALAALLEVLGDPFAFGQGRPPQLPLEDGC